MDGEYILLCILVRTADSSGLGAEITAQKFAKIALHKAKRIH